jgi:hypothetical protein
MNADQILGLLLLVSLAAGLALWLRTLHRALKNRHARNAFGFGLLGVLLALIARR